MGSGKGPGRNGGPMMYGQGGLGTSFKTARAHDADFGVLENHQNQFWSGCGMGVREGPREKRRSDDVRAGGPWD